MVVNDKNEKVMKKNKLDLQISLRQSSSIKNAVYDVKRHTIHTPPVERRL